MVDESTLDRVESQIAKLRKEYMLAELNDSTVSRDPFKQFQLWFREAQNAGIVESNAMTLATVSAQGQPSARLVLLKDFTETGLVFFSNYSSRKSKEIESNPRAAAVFYWPDLERQVRVEGSITKISEEKSDLYFLNRPRGSQVSAIISHQSYTIPNREVLTDKFNTLIKSEKDNFERPEYWGGYILRPHYFEFWQGRENRLHDRICYKFNAKEKTSVNWLIERLAP